MSHPLATSNIDNGHEHFKEKQTVKDKRCKVTTDNTYNFAPPNHKFKPPSNVRKILIGAKVKEPVEVSQRVTRSQTSKSALQRKAAGKISNSRNGGTREKSSMLLNVEDEFNCIGVELNEPKQGSEASKGIKS